MSFWYPENENARGSRRPLYLFLLAALGVGAVASIFTEPNLRTWYMELSKPHLAPPRELFAPAWTVLYVLSAIAAWRVWKITGFWFPAAKTSERDRTWMRAHPRLTGLRIEMTAFGLQLLLNLAWSITVFGFHDIGTGLFANILLDGTLLVTLLLFWRHDKIAALLLLPCFAWSCFTALLTYQLWQLNGQAAHG